MRVRDTHQGGQQSFSFKRVSCEQVMSRGAGKYFECVDKLFSNACEAVRQEVSTNMLVAQRGQLLKQVLAAFIAAAPGGQAKLVRQLLAIENFAAHLEDQGGSAAAVLADAIIDAARIEGPDLMAGQLDAETLGVVWDAIMAIGGEMAAARAAQDPSLEPAPTCVPLSDPQ